MTSDSPQERTWNFIPLLLKDIGNLFVMHCKFGKLLCRSFFYELRKSKWNIWTKALISCVGQILFLYVRANYRPSSVIVTTVLGASHSTWTFFSICHYGRLLIHILTLHRLFFCCCACDDH